MNKNVLVLIITWNGAGVIRRCLNSLRRSVMPIVIYVVDNNSDAETVRIIQEEYPEVILHINSDNIGFGQANNIGLRYAAQNGFDHVMMLNQDTYIEPDAILKLVEVQISNPSYALLSPMHYKDNGLLDGNFYRYIVGGCSALILDLLTHSSADRDVYSCGFINAAAWLLSKECITKVGGFNPIFFHTGEDVDYFNRVDYMKLGTGVVPQSVIYHTRSNWGKLKGYSNPYLHRYIHYEVALLNPQSDYKIAMILRALSKEAFCQLIFGKTGACKNVLSMAFKLWKHRHLFEGEKKGYIDF